MGPFFYCTGKRAIKGSDWTNLNRQIDCHGELFVKLVTFIEPIEYLYMDMTDSELHFAKRAIRRKKLFLALSIISVTVALSLALFYSWQFATKQPGFAPGIHFVLVLLILLTARQNLRQYRYAKILEKLIA